MVALNRAGCFVLYLMRPATKSAMDFLFEWLASAGCQDGHLDVVGVELKLVMIRSLGSTRLNTLI